jgi:hypothetical protein
MSKNLKKLVLKKDTISVLESVSLTKVKGGENTVGCYTNYHCTDWYCTGTGCNSCPIVGCATQAGCYV